MKNGSSAAFSSSLHLNNMIKALFFDIDGTLVSINTHHIPSSTIRALVEAKRRGVKIIISTGRPPIIITCLKEMEEHDLIDGYVTMNGAYCFIGDRLLHKNSIPRQDAQTLIEYCEQEQLPCIIVGEHSICCCPPGRLIDEIFHEGLHVDVDIPPVSKEEALSHEIFQLTPFIDRQHERVIFPQMPHCELGRWHPLFVDITARGNTKQLGVQHVMEYYGLKPSEIMTFGDGGNDIPMLRIAGIGVAMGNASPDVQAAADYVTDHVDEDGILHALQHFNII